MCARQHPSRDTPADNTCAAFLHLLVFRLLILKASPRLQAVKHVFIVGVVLSVGQIVASGQQPLAHQSALRTIDNGVSANGRYSNDCAGISFPIPKGWEVTKRFARNLPQITAKSVATDQHLLLTITRDQGGWVPDWFALTAIDARGAKLSGHDFISQFARSEMNRNNDKNEELIRDGVSFKLGRRRYFRSDYMRSFAGGIALYHSFVATSFRNYFLVWMAESSSPNNLDQSIASLQSVEFREDPNDALCDPVNVGKAAP